MNERITEVMTYLLNGLMIEFWRLLARVPAGLYGVSGVHRKASYGNFSGRGDRQENLYARGPQFKCPRII